MEVLYQGTFRGTLHCISQASRRTWLSEILVDAFVRSMLLFYFISLQVYAQPSYTFLAYSR